MSSAESFVTPFVTSFLFTIISMSKNLRNTSIFKYGKIVMKQKVYEHQKDLLIHEVQIL